MGSSQFIYDGYGNLRLTIKHNTVKAKTQSRLTISDHLVESYGLRNRQRYLADLTPTFASAESRIELAMFVDAYL